MNKRSLQKLACYSPPYPSKLDEKMSEAEVLSHLQEVFPNLPNIPNPGYILWNHTAFPFYDGPDALAYWTGQIEEYLSTPSFMKELG